MTYLWDCKDRKVCFVKHWTTAYCASAVIQSSHVIIYVNVIKSHLPIIFVNTLLLVLTILPSTMTPNVNNIWNMKKGFRSTLLRNLHFHSTPQASQEPVEFCVNSTPVAIRRVKANVDRSAILILWLLILPPTAIRQSSAGAQSICF